MRRSSSTLHERGGSAAGARTGPALGSWSDADVIYGLYLSTAGAESQSYRQDVIANNIANVDSTGFKRQFAILQARADHETEFGGPPPQHPDDPRRLGGGMYLFHIENDLKTTGAMQVTSRDADLAVQGDGYFQIRRDGQRFLTRAGDFRLNSLAQLCTEDDNALVMSESGEPIRLNGSQPYTVMRDGRVLQDEALVARITLVQPLEPERMRRAGEAMFSYDGALGPATGKIEQSMLEGSNVEPISEFVDLIETSRAFEINVQMIQLQSDGLRDLIQTVPRLT